MPKHAPKSFPVSAAAGMPACPCGRVDAKGRVLDFARCCGRYIGHFEQCAAPDAESLMRSRYSAFVLHDEAYLLATWHRDTRPPSIAFDAAARWLGLEVREHRVVGDAHAAVEFVARLRARGRGERLHERSRFVREGLRWYYVDGDLGL